MTTELMRDFGIKASQLGQFSAFYFYAYILMQIPTGVLVDSWGARRLLIGGSLAAAAGTLMFGLTTSYLVASIGRAIVGASTAVGWVVTLKLATHWFPKSRFAMLSGLGLMMGNLGALFRAGAAAPAGRALRMESGCAGIGGVHPRDRRRGVGTGRQ